MAVRLLSAVLIRAALLLPAAALAQTQAAPAQNPAAPAQTPAAPPASGLTPAPMPDPLMSPDLRTISGGQPTLPHLVAQSAWQDAVIAAARQQYKVLPYACPAGALKPTGKLTVFAPPQFDAQGTLVAGVWTEEVDATGCGKTRRLNVLTILQPGSTPQRIPTMPGDTHADPATQKSALQYAQAVAVRAAPPGCREQTFVNTEFDGYTGLPNPEVRDGRDSRAWRENWIVNACGKDYSIGMTFTPNAEGTQLAATNPVPVKAE